MTPRGKFAPFIHVASLLLVALPGGAEIVSDPPQAHSPITLLAVSNRASGRAAFAFEGKEQPPVIRAMPGESIRITYRNAMSPTSTEKCATGPCMNMTNLHFHGLHVSPNAPQDDVLTMVAMPGQSLQYAVTIPRNQPPGLYWYHTHPHGESSRQVLDGMSGAIVVEGTERYVPEIRNMPERILVLRDRAFEGNDPDIKLLKQVVEMPAQQCGSSTEQPERILTVNGAVRPANPDCCWRTTVLAYRKCFARPLRGLADRWCAMGDCRPGRNALGLSRPDAPHAACESCAGAPGRAA